MKKVSLKDIARMVGASPSTVSFVLNGKATEMRISDKLADKILKVAKRENYQPNNVAVSLRTGKSKIIGLVVDTISGNFFASLARIIESEAEHFGYKVIYCSTGNEIKKARELLGMLYQYHVDGYLIIPTEGLEKEIENLSVNRKPLVLMDSYFSGTNLPYVLVNNYQGVSQAITHLIEKGYRKIGFVCNDIPMIQMQERKRGYLETLQSNNIPFNKRLLLETGYKDPEQDIVQNINTFILKNKPEAIMFAANYLGVYGLESIKSLNLSIPGDIAMVCFDDHEIFRLFSPSITSIQQPVEAIAKLAIQLLMQQLGKIEIKDTVSQVEVSPVFLLRNST
ncbi:MAG: LacI family DNA-binding transcriptional regulator [Chitinophagaceae bacterium]|nr:LacI family DNA-binding transcriptional regulator [Chitinophagaceae bacterium]